MMLGTPYVADVVEREKKNAGKRSSGNQGNAETRRRIGSKATVIEAIEIAAVAQ